jgi:hypothetical protein
VEQDVSEATQGTSVDAFEEAPPTHAEDGTDLTLIRWMLSLTVEERLNFWQSQLVFIQELQRQMSHATLR